MYMFLELQVLDDYHALLRAHTSTAEAFGERNHSAACGCGDRSLFGTDATESQNANNWSDRNGTK